MLLAIRDKAQGWIAWAIVILISIPFALFGIEQYTSGGSKDLAATVDGAEITNREFDQSFNMRRAQLAQMLSGQIDLSLLDDGAIRKAALDDLIEDVTVRQFANNVGMRAGDGLVQNAVKNLPELQLGGQFDHTLYENVLRQQNLSPAGFADRVRTKIVNQQLQDALQKSAFLTEAERARLAQLRQQTRSGLSFTIRADSQDAGAEPTEDEINTYYSENGKRFERAERVKIEFIEVKLSDIADAIDIDEASLESHYEASKAEFTDPEQRRVRHILIRLETDADDETLKAAQAKMDDAIARLSSGEDFAEVAKDLSEDPGSAAKGGDLGKFGKGRMVEEFETAAFALEANTLSEPVRSPFGLHLIQVDEIFTATSKPFESVREQIQLDLQREEAEQQYYEVLDAVQTAVYESSDTLEPAADIAGVAIQTSDWLTQASQSGVFSSAKVSAAAFSEDVLQERNNSELLEVEAERYVAVRVTDYAPAKIPPLNEVRDQIVDLIQTERRQQTALAKAEKAMADIQSGQAPIDVAAALEVPLDAISAATRTSFDPSADVIKRLFSMPEPGADDRAVAVAEIGLVGDQAVVVLNKVVTPEVNLDELDAAETEVERIGQYQFAALLKQLRNRAEVEIFTGADNDQ